MTELDHIEDLASIGVDPNNFPRPQAHKERIEVLLAERDRELRGLVRLNAHQAGYLVHTSRDLLANLDGVLRLPHEPFVIVILDVTVPSSTRWVVKGIRERGEKMKKEIPLIMTAMIGTPDIEIAKELADFVLPKPYSMSVLMETLKEAQNPASTKKLV